MRFGGNLFTDWKTPDEWAKSARDCGYSAVYFPLDYHADTKTIDAFLAAAKAQDLVICEIGAWNNVLSPDSQKRADAYERAIHQLELADYLNAACCVNIAGTYHPTRWDGPHPDNMTERGFDDIVASCQKIIDAVHPKHTFYTLEPMPYMYPDSADCYLRLIRAIDRPAFGVHVDMVNIISSPTLYYHNGEVMQEWFDKLGPYIKACHAKDIILREHLTVHLDECRPGTGALDYDVYLKGVDQLGGDVCLMLEHMTDPNDYVLASAFIKEKAKKLNIRL